VIRYDVGYLPCVEKLTESQLNLVHYFLSSLTVYTCLLHVHMLYTCVSAVLCIRGVHGNGEDWDPMGPMGFPWEWE